MRRGLRPCRRVAAGAANASAAGRRPARLRRRWHRLERRLLLACVEPGGAAQPVHERRPTSPDGEQGRCRSLADVPQPPAWTFGDETPLAERPTGGSIDASYFANQIRLHVRPRDEHLPALGEPGREAGRRGDRQAGRAQERRRDVRAVRAGSRTTATPRSSASRPSSSAAARAYVATNGRTISARWVKSSLTAPTRFLDAKGRPIALTPGQTFVQVMPIGSRVTITAGKVPPRSPGRRRRPGAPGRSGSGLTDATTARRPRRSKRPRCASATPRRVDLARLAAPRRPCVPRWRRTGTRTRPRGTAAAATSRRCTASSDQAARRAAARRRHRGVRRGSRQRPRSPVARRRSSRRPASRPRSRRAPSVPATSLSAGTSTAGPPPRAPATVAGGECAGRSAAARRRLRAPPARASEARSSGVVPTRRTLGGVAGQRPFAARSAAHRSSVHEVLPGVVAARVDEVAVGTPRRSRSSAAAASAAASGVVGERRPAGGQRTRRAARAGRGAAGGRPRRCRSRRHDHGRRALQDPRREGAVRSGRVGVRW